MLVHMMIESGELSREEAWDFYERIMELPSLYKGFMDEFKRKTGVELRKGTMIADIKESAFACVS